MSTQIIISAYDPAWPALYAAERDRLWAAIGAWIADIQHVGSTSVPRLAAKPTIDIMVGVRSLADADAHCIPAIIALGYDYIYQYEADTPERRYFQKLSAAGQHTHHIHLVTIDSDWWARHLAFRDYLRAHPHTADAYAQLKYQLAATLDDRRAYTEAKTDFIRAVEKSAWVWLMTKQP